MATGVLAITNTSFPDNSTADGSQVITNFNDILDYVNNRNDGTDEWSVLNVTATVTAAATISGNQATTLMQLNNTATDGDPVFEWALGGTVQFSAGVDDGDSDVWKLGTTAIGTNTMIEADSNGAIRKVLQPCFLVHSAATQTDVTGDGTAVTVVLGTEIFDQGGDFATNTFTAPVAGKYIFSATIDLDGLDTTNQTDINMLIVTSQRSYVSQVGDIPAGVTRWSAHNSVLCDMDASDTAFIRINVGGSSKTVDITSGATATYFSGSLIN